MSTADGKAYEAQVAEILDSVTSLERARASVEETYRTALGYADAAEKRAAETVDAGTELIERSLRNAREGVKSLVEDTLIPPRMLPSAVAPNVGHADVDEALAQLNQSVIALRTLADRVRAAQSRPAPTPPPPPPPEPPRPPAPVPKPGVSPKVIIAVAAVVILAVVLFMLTR